MWRQQVWRTDEVSYQHAELIIWWRRHMQQLQQRCCDIEYVQHVTADRQRHPAQLRAQSLTPFNTRGRNHNSHPLAERWVLQWWRLRYSTGSMFHLVHNCTTLPGLWCTYHNSTSIPKTSLPVTYKRAYRCPHNVCSWRVNLWRPLLPYGYSYRASCARPG